MSIPTGWQTARLLEVTAKPLKVDPATTGRDHVQYVDIGSLEGPEQRLSSATTVVSAEAPSRCRQVVRAGDTIYSTVRPYLRKMAYIGDDLDGEFASTGFCVLRPRPALEAKYLYHWCTSAAFEDQILPLQKGVSYPAVLDKEVRATSIHFPSRTEQRRIVELVEEHLSHLDAADASLDQAIERASLLPRLTAETGWHDTGRRIPLGTLGKTVTGNTPRESQSGHLTPFITPGDVMHGDQISTVERSLSLDQFSKARVSDGPTVYVVCIGATLGKAGWREEIAAFNQQINTLNLPSAEAAAVMSALLASPSGQTELRREVAATTMPILNKTKFSRVLVPSLTTVQIADLHHRLQLVQASTSQTLGDLYRAQQQSVALRRATLAAAFSGRLTGSSSDTEVINEAAAGLAPHGSGELP